MPRTLPATLLLLPIALPACASFGPLTAATEARLWGLPPLGRAPPGRFEVTLSVPSFAGDFSGVLAATAGDPIVVRLQLFPEIGGKLLDLRVGATEIEAWLAGMAPYRCPLPVAADQPPHLALLLGIALREALTPLSAARVRGERRAAHGVELLLEPAVPGGEVVARLDRDLRLCGYAFRYGRLRFTLDHDGTLAGPGLSGRLCWGEE